MCWCFWASAGDLGAGAVVKRDLDRMRRVLRLIEDDLRRTLDSQLACSLDDEWVLRVSLDARSEAVLVDDLVDREAWPDQAWHEYREDTLDDDASEVLASEVLEILRALDLPGPVCPEHRTALDVCSMSWVCGSINGHDAALMGELRTPSPEPDPI